jgi:hypothetical protein
MEVLYLVIESLMLKKKRECERKEEEGGPRRVHIDRRALA